MRFPSLVVAFAGAALIAATSYVVAAPRDNATSRGLAAELRQRIVALVTSEARPTPEQLGAIRDVLAAHRVDLATVLRPLVEAERDLRAATLSGASDELAIRTAAENLGTKLADAAVVAARLRAQIQPLLTADQIEAIGLAQSTLAADIDVLLDRLEEAAAR